MAGQQLRPAAAQLPLPRPRGAGEDGGGRAGPARGHPRRAARGGYWVDTTQRNTFEKATTR